MSDQNEISSYKSVWTIFFECFRGLIKVVLSLSVLIASLMLVYGLFYGLFFLMNYVGLSKINYIEMPVLSYSLNAISALIILISICALFKVVCLLDSKICERNKYLDEHNFYNNVLNKIESEVYENVLLLNKTLATSLSLIMISCIFFTLPFMDFLVNRSINNGVNSFVWLFFIVFTFSMFIVAFIYIDIINNTDTIFDIFKKYNKSRILKFKKGITSSDK